MPANEKAHKWFIAFDGDDDEMVKGHFKDYESIHIMKHKGIESDHPHYHVAITYKEQQSKQTIKNRLLKSFNLPNKDQHSIKEWNDKNEAMAYMYHEENAYVIITTYSEEQQSIFKKINDEVQDRKKGKKKSEEVNRWDMILEIRKLSGITDVDLTNWKYHNEVGINKEFVYENMVKVLESHKKLCHITEMERLYVSVLRVVGASSQDFFQKIKSKTEL